MNAFVQHGRLEGQSPGSRVPWDLIEQTARKYPERVALQHDTVQLTYGDLLARTGALARRLRAAGVAADMPVAICLPRTPAFVVAMLAVARAGGCFVPIDPEWPQNRIRYVLDDVGAVAVVTTVDRFDWLASPGRALLVAATDEDRADPRDLDLAAGGELAYIIYTSGSTGAPKGVEITNRNLLNLMAWHCAAFDVSSADRASCVAGLGFDAVVWEIWPHLSCGACVCLCDDAVRAAPTALARWLVDMEISIAFAPTPLAEPIMLAPWPQRTRLRYLLTGGDVLHVRPRHDLPFAVVNNYGPTECTVVTTSGAVGPSDAMDVPPIGWPIDGAIVRILDDRGVPVKDGRAGEICIGGAGVARGYRNRPALTAEKFVADPLAGPTDRLYRTGDLGRWLDDGQIAFIGRHDDQVKVRGHRVELEEISTALNHHPAVVQSVVMHRRAGTDAILIAYVVLGEGAVPLSGELRLFLAQHLPEPMLPAAFVRLAALPLATSGKVDRRALPDPGEGNLLPDEGFRAPSSEIEVRLARLVAEVLEIDRVGLDDNFFLLGGHSLLGTQLLIKARETFGAALTLRDLFQSQTVANLAARIEQRILESPAQANDEPAPQTGPICAIAR